MAGRAGAGSRRPRRSAHREVTLIGWSLGGLYAREIAKALPHRVRQVITLGTPFARIANSTNVQWLYELLSGTSAAVDARWRAG